MKKILAAALAGALLLMLASCNYSVNVGWGATYHYEDASSYTMGGAELTDAIREIDISWVNGSVTVQYHDGDTVLISETSNAELTEKSSLYYRVVGDTLKIQYAQSGVWTNIDFNKELTVSLPKGTETKLAYDLSFETVSADVDILGIDTEQCEFENVSGNVRAALLGKTSSLNIETVSGNVNVSVENLASFDIESVSGNVSLTGGDIKNGDIETVSGDFSLMMPPNQGYTLNFDSVSGDVDLYGASVSKEGDCYTVGDGTRRYDVETVSGNVKISEYKV